MTMRTIAAVVFAVVIAYGVTSPADGIDLAAVSITYKFLSPNEIEITTNFDVHDGFPDSVKTIGSNLYFGADTISDSIVTGPAPFPCPEPPEDCTGDCTATIDGKLEMGECENALVWDAILQDTVFVCGCKTGCSRTGVFAYSGQTTIGFELDPDGMLDEYDESNNYVEVQVVQAIPTTDNAGLLIILLVLLATGVFVVMRMKLLPGTG
jgi:hypothetical protein